MENIIITIGRQFGSGGREIGESVAKTLGIPFYDNELITLAAKKSGMSQEVLKNMDEKPSSFLYSLSISTTPFGSNISPIYDMPINDKIFLSQSEVINELASQGACVIVGRCADYVLRAKKNMFSVFIRSDIQSRVERKRSLNPDLSDNKLKELIIKTDKKRASYYNYYTSRKWGLAETYHLTIDSGLFGMEGSVKIITDCYECLRSK